MTVAQGQVWFDVEAAERTPGRIRLLEVLSPEPGTHVVAKIIVDTHPTHMSKVNGTTLVAVHRMVGRPHGVTFRRVEGAELERLKEEARRAA